MIIISLFYYCNFIILLFYYCVYLYEYMDDWEKFNEASFPEKENFYSDLNMDLNYTHEKSVCKDFEIKPLGEYHDLYVQSETSLLADVFENFRNMCFKVYKLDPARFLLNPGLAWQAALKKTKVKLSFNWYLYVFIDRKRY